MKVAQASRSVFMGDGVYELTLWHDERGWYIDVGGVRIRPIDPIPSKRQARLWFQSIIDCYSSA